MSYQLEFAKSLVGVIGMGWVIPIVLILVVVSGVSSEVSDLEVKWFWRFSIWGLLFAGLLGSTIFVGFFQEVYLILGLVLLFMIGGFIWNVFVLLGLEFSVYKLYKHKPKEDDDD